PPVTNPLSLHDALPICDLKRSVGAFHASPPSGDRRVQQLSVYPLATSARLLLWIQRAARRTKSSFAASELSGSALRLDSERAEVDRKSTRLNSSHLVIS